MLTCIPVWADTLANFARVWTWTMFVVLLPKYFNDVFAMQVDSGSSLSMLPHLVTAVMLPLGGGLADLMLEKKILSVTNVRKLFNCGGFGGEVVMLVVLMFTRDRVTSTIALTIASGSATLAESGYSVNKLNMAPRYAGILEGFENGFSFVGGKSYFLLQNKRQSPQT